MIITVVGVAILGAGIAIPEQRATGLLLGAFLLSVSCFMVLGAARRAAPGWSLTTLDGRPAWALRIGGTGAAAMLVVPGLLATVLLVAASRAPRAAAVVAGAIALFLLVLAAEGLRLVLRRPELRLGVDRIELRGPGIDSTLAWDDVAAVTHHHLGTRWGAVVAEAATDATTYDHELSRWLLPTDRVPDPPGVCVRVGLVPDVPRLTRLMRAMHVADRAGREAMISRGLPEQSGF
ncbi:hypothetical protein ACFP3Q_11500 [Nocardioides sp. GCM10027113]|uniref:hypothetical protein n=1 Tax=unclassified Nocardioides TaxID=2615069 RepID=UPI00361569EB